MDTNEYGYEGPVVPDTERGVELTLEHVKDADGCAVLARRKVA
jgi:hypothetical protein